ncbi:2',5'-phosphodiesterase 12 [Cydia amplana]|uniref:2',5'-phosphodiesterase 12 n=1 Tax=Cydia amplana TaxID=1869771 RepID=UPI002FE50BB8
MPMKANRAMFCRIFNIGRKFYSGIALSKSNIMNTEQCYFRYNKSEDKIDLTFLLKVKESVRQFNLSRKPSESVENLLTRIGANVHKVVRKGNKKKSTSETEEIKVKVFDGDKCLPESLTCLELFSLPGPVKFQIQDHIYEAVFNVPWIESLSLPQSILSGFGVYPEHFSFQNTDVKQCVYNWYTCKAVNDKGNTISEFHLQWELVGTGYCYIPTVQDIGKKLKLECIPKNGTIIGPAVDAISKNNIEAGPGRCPFETRHMFTRNLLSDKSFRCVSYNILADLYCDSEFTRTVLHPYCPPYALHIDYRKQLIIKELLGYNADIICLQEVDQKIFKTVLDPLLGNNGFKGLFYKKGKEVAEGLACFYRDGRYEFLSEEHIVLSEALKSNTDLKPIWDAVKQNSRLAERVLDRSTVASVTILRSLENPKEILLVGNTHLYFHPDADHIRLLQGGMVIYWLKQIKKRMHDKFSDHRMSLILCGDFNSVPSNGIYQLYTTGSAPSSLPDWNSKPDEAVLDLNLQQDILLGSACGTPQYTNFTAGFADCLDYIYYEKANIEVEQVVPFPSVEELQAHTALPSIVFPSDHIALISDLRFIS